MRHKTLDQYRSKSTIRSVGMHKPSLSRLSVNELMKDLKPGSYLAGDNSEYLQKSEKSSLYLPQVLRPNLDADPDLILQTQARRHPSGSVMDKSGYYNSMNNSLGEDRSYIRQSSQHSYNNGNGGASGHANRTMESSD